MIRSRRRKNVRFKIYSLFSKKIDYSAKNQSKALINTAQVQKNWFEISQTNFKPVQIKFIYPLPDAWLGIVRRRELNQHRSLT